jgi:hypothetical protein
MPVPKFPIRKRMAAILYKEQGFALVLVMLMVLLLTILGLAVLSAAVGGAQRSEVRESDVQTLHLTEKSLEEAVSYITTGLNNKALDTKDLEQTIKVNIDNLLKKNLSVATDLDKAEGKIIDITFDKFVSGEQSLKYYVTITASAKVNGVERKLQQQLIIDAFPDFLKYVLGSERNVILNGAPLIRGNLYAGNELLISDTAHYIYRGKPQQRQTLFPKVEHITGNDEYGEVHVQSLNSMEVASSSGEYTPVTTSSLGTSADDNLNKVLGLELNATNQRFPLDKVKIKEQKKFVQINVEESFIDKLLEAADPQNQRHLRSDVQLAYEKGTLNDWLRMESSIRSISKPDAPVKGDVPEDATDEQRNEIEDEYRARMEQYYKDLDEQLNNLSSSVVYTGNFSVDGSGREGLLIDGIDYRGLTYTDNAKKGILTTTSPQWFIVAGDLVIDNYNSGFLPLKGNILVTGNVTIKGNVKFDSTMFVLGETTVVDATIKGINDSELLLISKGKTLINRLDAFASNEPDEMRAFFYTDSSADLYGVGSMFWLNGGFFAKGDLTVNAVVGTVREPLPDNATTDLDIDTQTQGSLVRFKVDYNYDVYKHQQSSLPRVQSVNVQVGPIQWDTE